MRTKARRNSDAKFEFDQVRNGNYSLLVSSHVLLEIMKVLVDEAMRQPGIKNNPSASNIRSYVTSKFTAVVVPLMKLPNTRIVDPQNLDAKTLFETALDFSQRIFGGARFHSRGRGRYLKYHGPLQIDFYHAIVACHMGCDELLTFDQGFQALIGEPLIHPLKIQVI